MLYYINMQLSSCPRSDVQSENLDAVVDAQQVLWALVRSRYDDRAREGLTQSQLARALNRPPSQISVWLSAPDRSTLKAAARLLAAMGGELELRVVDRSDPASR